MSRRTASSLLITAGKAAITILALAIVLSQIDFSFVFSHRHKLSTLTLAAALLLLAVQTSIIAGLRLKLVLEALGQRRALSETLQVALSGFFFEQVAFGFVGGDAMRVWQLHQSDVPLRTALEAIVIDRFLGSFGLLLLALVGLPGLLAVLTGYDWRAIVAVAAVAAPIAGALAGVVLVQLAKRRRVAFVAEIVDLATAAVRRPEVRRCLLSAFALASTTHFMNVFVFFLIGRDLSMGLGLGSWFLIAPPALLISMLPISAGGWGIREASFVFGLASFGIRPEEAIIPPVVFGLGVLVVTLPGGIIWLANRASRRTPGGTSPAGREGADAEREADALAAAGSGEDPGRYRRELMPG